MSIPSTNRTGREVEGRGGGGLSHRGLGGQRAEAVSIKFSIQFIRLGAILSGISWSRENPLALQWHSTCCESPWEN
ncbi:hypothetical protein SETIT_5G039500v2 [Setaria italica]|uniref:Uncharacterized protein n=2 Tax=Setaria TaxID=4554 RepID=A0A368R1E2_SETIT|nr:hypothetical protein SETIT_5G039500v2 [Setaria italica]TKW12464.1 hypothetical protein SEVIR_5G037400v2 [Setaria viridis]